MTRLRFLAVGTLLLAGALALAAARWSPWPAPFAAGVLLAWALAVPSYLALSITLHRSDAVFFGVFAGGMLVRLAALLGGILVVHRAGVWPVAPFAVAAAAGLTGFTVIELIFLHGQNKKWTSSTPSNTTSSTTSTSA